MFGVRQFIECSVVSRARLFFGSVCPPFTEKMSTASAANRKLPAWIGSILFHTLLLILVLLWFSSGSNRSAPGERTAVGTLILQSDAGARQQAETAATDPQTADAELTMAESETFSQIDLHVVSPIPTLSPGQPQNAAQPADSAADLTAMLQNTGMSNAGMGNQTGEAVVQFFGAEGKGTKFMFVLDRSGSMEGKPLQRAKEKLVQSLESLGNLHQFNILFYNGTDDWLLLQRGRQLVFASASEKQRAVRFVAGITADGGTRHFNPLLEAILHRPDVIFFLTDGERYDDLTADQLREIERRNSRGVQINVIQFGSGGFTDSPSESLKQLAAQNQGEYRYVNVLGL